MQFRLYFLKTIFIFLVVIVVVSASTDYSDFLIADDKELELDFTSSSLPVYDLTTLFNKNELGLPLFDQTTPPLDNDLELFSSYLEDPFGAEFDISTTTSPETSSLLDLPSWDDTSSELAAGCLASEISLSSSALVSRSRVVRRTDDDSSSCQPYPQRSEEDQLFESLQRETYSITCNLITRGVLPIAMVPSDSPKDVVTNGKVIRSIYVLNAGLQSYCPVTLYRATIRVYTYFRTCIYVPKNSASPYTWPFQSVDVSFELTWPFTFVVADVALVPPGRTVYCCQTFEKQFFFWTTGINCVELTSILFYDYPVGF